MPHEDSQLGRTSKPEDADWTPWLMIAPEIIRDLGICMAIASTRDVTRVQLDIEGTLLKRNDIPSNLVRVANDGQRAFTHACSALQKISYMTEQICSPGGLLDDLEDAFADPTEQEFATMLVEQIQEYINDCNENSKASKGEFDKLNDLIGDLSEGVTAAQSKLGQTIEQTEKEISTTEKTKSFEAAVLAEQEREKLEAGAKFNKILQTYDERSNKLDASLGFTALSVAGGIVSLPASLGGVLASAVFGGMLAAAASDLNAAEDRLSEKKRSFGQTQIKLANLDGELKTWLTAKNKLERTGRDIKATLELLADLSSGIAGLLNFFISMNTTMHVLVKNYDWSRKPVEAVQSRIAAGVDPSSKMEAHAKKRLLHVKQTAVVINALSNAYAFVIAEVVNQAWGMARKPTSNLLDGEVQDTIAAKRLELESYVEDAQRICRVKTDDTKRLMLKRLSDIADESRAGLGQ
ncbi:hypothetical protein IFR05_013139 [Cadophora sp. M221]|nr:hypothetical protein IFR05_013139 [Cadophora sp. M221]